MADAFVLSNTLRGGRSRDVPTFLRDTHCAEAIDVDFYYALCGNKRWGTEMLIAGATGEGAHPGDSNPWGSLIRYQPGADESAAELWMFRHGAISPSVQRLIMVPGGSPFAVGLDLPDALPGPLLPKSAGAEVRGATFNGKLYLAYASGVDRLHVWDPAEGVVRRVGIIMSPGLAPTLAGLGAGTITDTRRYKVAWVRTHPVSGLLTYRSELSDFTGPIVMVSQLASLTRPTAPGEGETYWELYAYHDDDSYAIGYRVAITPIGTTSAVDNIATLTTALLLAPEIGLNTPPSAWKYITVHGNRLLGAGTASPSGTRYNNRVWFTPPLGSGDSLGDDERVPDTLAAQNYVDLDENDGGYIIGFGGVINGSPIVFKTNGIHRLIPTGQAAQPYQVAVTPISKTIGGIRQEAIIPAEDEAGNPCVYWLAHNGPHRWTATRGIEYCGYDIDDIWQRTGSGDGYGQPHGLWYAQKKQIWWYLATPDTPRPRTANIRLVLHTQHCTSTGQGARGGWVRHTGHAMVSLASTVFASSTSLFGIPLRPVSSYGLQPGPSACAVLTCDVYNLLTDLGVTYQSSITSPAYALGGIANRFTTSAPLFLVRREVEAVFRESVFGAALSKDFAQEVLWDAVVSPVDGASATTRYQVRRMEIGLTEAHVAQFVFGDVGLRNIPAAWTDWWGIEAVMLERNDADERA